MTDTTTLLAEAERLAKTLDGEAKHRKAAEAIGDTDHVAWCDWMLSIGTTLRAQAEAAGVTAEGLGISASILEAYPARRDVAALLRALAEVLRDE